MLVNASPILVAISGERDTRKQNAKFYNQRHNAKMLCRLVAKSFYVLRKDSQGDSCWGLAGG
jgi:hypothetical protein